MDVGGRTINSPQSESRKEENIELSKLELLLLSSNDASAQAEEDSFLEKAKLKSKAKVVSAWNNMKYGFNVQYRPSFTDESPVWFLGKCYDKRKLADTDYIMDKKKFKVSDVNEFFENFGALIWLTYRKEFPKIENSTLTTDCGWGCMLRTGQMILANTLLIHFLKDDWRRASQLGYSSMNVHYRMILRFFNDEQSDYSPFSLHQLVKIGEENGHKAGDWYGPSTVAHILCSAMKNALHPTLESICIYVSQDCTVYKEDVISVATECRSCSNKECSERMWRSVLILVPVRLGGEGLNPIYIPCIKALLTLDHCIGIIGGRPKHSLYFVGFQDNKLLYLDPHYVQPKVDMSRDSFCVDTFHCPYPRKMAIKRMDPSCCIGFYCRKREDFEAFCKETVEVLKPPMQRTEYPMFIISEGSRSGTIFDSLDGLKARETVRTSLGSFSLEEDTPSQERKQLGVSGQRTYSPQPLGAFGLKPLRKKHRRRDVERSDRRKKGIDDYLVV